MKAYGNYLASLAIALAGCSGSHVGGDAGAALVSGRYEVQIIPLLLGANSVGPRLELTLDGAFAGHGDNLPPPTGDPHQCRGTLTAAESENLTAALNVADVLHMTDRFTCEIGHDYPQWHVAIMTGGGANNAFCYARCLTTVSFDRVLDAAAVPLARAQAAGACDGPIYEYVSGDDPYGCGAGPGP